MLQPYESHFYDTIQIVATEIAIPAFFCLDILQNRIKVLNLH